MPIGVKREYLEKIRLRYLKSSRRQKSLILDEFCKICDYDRKHAIKLLTQLVRAIQPKPGPKFRYGPEVIEHLLILWQAMGRICSKKVVAAIPLWLPFYDGGSIETRWLLQKMSASSIDRHLLKHREHWQRGMSGTQPSLIKNRVPIKLLDHDVTEPGFIEADTVAHCGTSLAGEFINSLTMTDLFSAWTENRAVWRKESKTVLKAIRSIEECLPFTVKGFASDNGNEFLNHDLASYFFNRKNRVDFVRRRPYKKNDNAHVEQKNWTHVRELFGYERLEVESQVEAMNDIYHRWNALWNFFTPVMKLKSKTRVGGRIVKLYDEPTTPYQRLLDSQKLTPEEEHVLRERFKKLNPFALKRELEEKLKWFFKLVEIRKKEIAEAG